MKWLVPQSLAGRLIALLLLALVASQLISFAIFYGERRAAIRDVIGSQSLARVASVVLLLDDTPAELRARVVATASSPRMIYEVTATPAVAITEAAALPRRLNGELSGMLGPGARDIRIETAVHARDQFEPEWRRLFPRRADLDNDDGHNHRNRQVPWLKFSIGLDDGTWLNAARQLPHGWAGKPRRAWPWILSMLLTAVAIAIIVIIVVRRITRPMLRLAEAADRLGRGEHVEPLPEYGPPEIRGTTRAFNQMRWRLDRFVTDRTRMLAALSHDLRTPMTSLRLRAEFVEDREQQAKIIETLDEMQRMAEATLAFVREEASHEDTHTEDLGQLLKDVRDELAALGQDVSFAPPGPAPVRCRPDALRRVFRNLIENAVRYGSRARVGLERANGDFLVTVDDDGAGIPQARQADVFEPFVRLEESRSRDTGGVGLGLAIARSIAHGHGGDITLENRENGGLRVKVALPAAAAG